MNTRLGKRPALAHNRHAGHAKLMRALGHRKQRRQMRASFRAWV